MEYISCNTANAKVQYVLSEDPEDNTRIKAIINETIREAIEATSQEEYDAAITYAAETLRTLLTK